MDIDWAGLKCSRPVKVGGELIEVATIKGLECIVQALLNVAITVGGFAVLFMFLIGGYKYLASAGDPKANLAAKNTLTYAVFGLFVMIAAWFFLQFIKSLTGVDVTIFEIPGS